MIKGFTLIELLVVVLIIGILSAIALPQYRKAVIKARFAEGIVNVKAIAQALDVCVLENGGSDSLYEACSLENLPIKVNNSTNFSYSVFAENYSPNAASSYDSISALYSGDEGVCLCYHNNQIKVKKNAIDCMEEGGSGSSSSINYAKLLNLPDAGDDCCCCCY